MVTEIVVYRTLPNITPEDHEGAATAAHRSVIARQPGFLRRTLGRVADQEDAWVDVVQWQSVGHAQSAMTVAASDSSTGPWLGQIDMGRLSMHMLRTSAVIGLGDDALSDPGIGCWLVVSWKTKPHVDEQEHQVGSEGVHREVLAKMAGYRGARLLRPVEGPEWFELIAWSDVGAAKAGIHEAMGSGDPLMATHLAEADEATVAMHFVAPRIRV